MKFCPDCGSLLKEHLEGYAIDNLSLFKVYTRDDLRLVWVVFTAQLGCGEFIENSETDEMLLFSKQNLPRIAYFKIIARFISV